MIKKQALNRHNYYLILLEKYFMKTLTKFLTDIKKTHGQAQKKAIKLKAQTAKINTQLKYCDIKIKTITQAMTTGTNKKKLMAAKKEGIKLSKLLASTHQKSQDILFLQEKLIREQNILLALRQYMNQFEKKNEKSFKLNKLPSPTQSTYAPARKRKPIPTLLPKIKNTKKLKSPPSIASMNKSTNTATNHAPSFQKTDTKESGN